MKEYGPFIRIGCKNVYVEVICRGRSIVLYANKFAAVSSMFSWRGQIELENMPINILDDLSYSQMQDSTLDVIIYTSDPRIRGCQNPPQIFGGRSLLIEAITYTEDKVIIHFFGSPCSVTVNWEACLYDRKCEAKIGSR